MLHMKFMTLAMALVNEAKDGDLTLDEISQCLQDFSPEYFSDVNDAVHEAQKDGRISVMETFKILTAIIT